ncbi:hypothetical protein ACQJBY_016831 [Aegilops geniculata]
MATGRRAAHHDDLLSTLLAAAGNGREEEEDAREARQRQNQRVESGLSLRRHGRGGSGCDRRALCPDPARSKCCPTEAGPSSARPVRIASTSPPVLVDAVPRKQGSFHRSVHPVDSFFCNSLPYPFFLIGNSCAVNM